MSRSSFKSSAFSTITTSERTNEQTVSKMIFLRFYIVHFCLTLQRELFHNIFRQIVTTTSPTKKVLSTKILWISRNFRFVMFCPVGGEQCCFIKRWCVVWWGASPANVRWKRERCFTGDYQREKLKRWGGALSRIGRWNRHQIEIRASQIDSNRIV